MKRIPFRKVLLAVLAALILTLPAAVTVFAGSGSSTKYVVSDMNFRSGPGTEYSIIGTVPRGSVVSYTSSYNDWDQIIYNGYVGFIHGGNLSDTAPSSSYSSSSSGTWTVRVSDGYLALRSAKAYDYSNEIGKLWTGDTVEVWDNSDSKYWYVYAPHLGKSGYVNKNYLYSASTSGEKRTVYVQSGYLALRTAQAYDSSNEIGKLWTGDTVQVLDKSGSTYWYVYAPSLGRSGYVNKNYLSGNTSSGSSGYSSSSSGVTKTVSVASGYLALRTAKAYDPSNEIGKLWTGDKVQVLDTNGYQYWYVYAPSLGKYGYVNKDYLF